MTCKWCHDDPHRENPPCSCACHFEDAREGFKRCDDERM